MTSKRCDSIHRHQVIHPHPHSRHSRFQTRWPFGVISETLLFWIPGRCLRVTFQSRNDQAVHSLANSWRLTQHQEQGRNQTRQRTISILAPHRNHRCKTCRLFSHTAMDYLITLQRYPTHNGTAPHCIHPQLRLCQTQQPPRAMSSGHLRGSSRSPPGKPPKNPRAAHSLTGDQKPTDRLSPHHLCHHTLTQTHSNKANRRLAQLLQC